MCTVELYGVNAAGLKYFRHRTAASPPYRHTRHAYYVVAASDTTN